MPPKLCKVAQRTIRRVSDWLGRIYDLIACSTTFFNLLPCSCCKFNKQTPNLCPNQFYLHNTQASYTQRKIFIEPPKFVTEPRSIALFHHNRRGYQRDTRPDQHASKYAPEQTTGGTYMPHGHFFIFILSSFLYLSSETAYDFLIRPI